MTSPTTLTLDELIALRASAAALANRPGQIRAQHSGGYLSRFRGRGMEYDESRPYQPGDDVRTLDWKVTARTGRAHTKLFREERERPVVVAVDLGRSMHFATRGAFKSVLASRVAALLGWRAIWHGDRFGGVIFSGSDHLELRPSHGEATLLRFCRMMAEHPSFHEAKRPALGSDWSALMARLRRVVPPGSHLILVSDFRQFDPEQHLTWLARHCGLALVHLSDPFERQLPPAGSYPISDGLRQSLLHTGATTFRHHYENEFTVRSERLQSFCRKNGAIYLPGDTRQEPLALLQQGLNRQAMKNPD